MLTNAFPFLLPQTIPQRLPGALIDLAADLNRIRDGHGPTAADLGPAPWIRRWRFTVTPVGVRLIGDVEKHPRLGNDLAMTSPIWAADPDGKWVRTTSRFYKLGAPLQDARNGDNGDQHACDFEGGL